MKKLGLYILLAFLIAACQKESEITPGIGYEHLYTIQDDPTDSIQHKRYELYTTYGVPVYFNDTIGKVFVKTDINGDSIFRYELLDMNWAFDNDNSTAVSYQVTRHKDPALMMKALRFTEVFLENSQPALYPYAIWLTEKCYQLSSSGADPKPMVSRYRNLMFSWTDEMKEDEMLSTALAYRNDVVKLKVQNYTDELNAFNKISDEKDYDQAWSSLYPNEIMPYWKEIDWYPAPLTEEWRQDGSFRNTLIMGGNWTNPNFPPYGVGTTWTDVEVDNYIVYCRGLVGAYGFVTYSQSNVRMTPRNTEEDLELFLVEMMKYPREQFLERWESCPLVLKKYEILYAIIRDELGVEL